ncbi:MAG TPA: hypothetical protein VFE12_07375, partial [Acetobacteraceae bacterium]|nr:hypothetical protein [Acetobacteraceae bacterium]
ISASVSTWPGFLKEAAGERNLPVGDRFDTRIAAKMGGTPAMLNTCIALAVARTLHRTCATTD